ncbi:MAG: TM1802 family CRISPR-associated protein [Candidatus Nanoarchaeia archaeon]|nr:TM1802 family CRISPR-associated protein [Candidatus Nanoarchaeia archaeon]
MIEKLKKIGESVLNNSSDELMSETDQRRVKLLGQLIEPKSREEVQRAICINFDMAKQTFKFELDKELVKDNSEYFFALSQGGQASRIFAATNSLGHLLYMFYDDTIRYLTDCRNAKKSRDWFEKNISNDYDNLITQLKGLCKETDIEGKKKLEKYFILSNSQLDEEQQVLFSVIYDQVKADELTKEIDKQKNEIEILEIAYTKLIYQLFNLNAKKIPGIFLLKFDGKTILEYENCKYKDDYINLMYYWFFEKSGTEKGTGGKTCHVCGKTNTAVSSDFIWKFFGTTNNLYFDGTNNKNDYKAFGMCSSCSENIKMGINFIENDLGDFSFGMTYFIIPNLKDGTKVQKECKGIIKLLDNKDIADLDMFQRLSDKMDKFDVMFYYKPPASKAFNVLKLISNIEIKDYLAKLKNFIKFNEKYNLYSLGDFGHLSFSDIRYHIFPSNSSHVNPDFKIYGKKLLDFLDEFLTGKPISYNFLISNFMDIAKLRYHKDRYDKLSAFKLNIFITMLNELNMLKGERMETTGNFITEIAKKEYADFFATHKAVYEENSFRQGLFLMGTVISKIKYAQSGKSSNFLDKLNFDGISPRRIPQLVNQVKEYSLIYKIYEEQGIWANITDRLQGIELIQMRPDEVLFYILSGVSYEDYLGIMFAKQQAALNTENVTADTPTQTTNLN